MSDDPGPGSVVVEQFATFREEHRMSDTTIVLIHGAFADASSWQPAYDALSADGHTVLAPPNPLNGVVADAAYFDAVLRRIDGPALLVGHSYGGAVATVAGVAENVVGLVYVAGFAPDAGESLTALQAPYPPPAAAPHLVQNQLAGDAVEVQIDPTAFPEVFCADVPIEQARFMAIAQRPISLSGFTDEASAAAWRSTPSWAVLPTADGAIHPDVHHASYERAGATVTVAEGASHAVMLSQPALVVDVIREAARATAADKVA